MLAVEIHTAKYKLFQSLLKFFGSSLTNSSMRDKLQIAVRKYSSGKGLGYLFDCGFTLLLLLPLTYYKLRKLVSISLLILLLFKDKNISCYCVRIWCYLE